MNIEQAQSRTTAWIHRPGLPWQLLLLSGTYADAVTAILDHVASAPEAAMHLELYIGPAGTLPPVSGMLPKSAANCRS